MAIPQPEPRDWLLANAKELQITDRQVLQLLRDSKKRVDALLNALPKGKQAIRRSQLEHARANLLAEQASLFQRLGDVVSARRADAASRAARLNAAADDALLRAVGKGAQSQFLYESALQISQRAIDTALARMKLSALPLSQRIYNTSVWMNGRLGRLINETIAAGVNAQEFAKRARDWFNPNTPGGVRYAAMRLARTEINNAFHAISAQKYNDTPWITEAEWHLSKSHPRPDICNVVAEESPYPSDKIPARPHPQCMCYITPKSVDEDEFVENFLKGDYDAYLDGELAKNGWVDPEPQMPVVPPKQRRSAPKPVPAAKPAPEPAPVKVPEQETVVSKSVPDPSQYRPGAWELQTGNEARIAEIESELQDKLPDMPAAAIRAMAEKFIAGSTKSTDVTYRNGSHEVRFTGTLTTELQKVFLGHVDTMQSRFPVGHSTMNITVGPSTDFGFNVGGETTMGTGDININERTLTQETWPGMPVSSQVSSALYVLAHEWGHALSTPEDGRNKHVHDSAIKAGGMTRYGTVGADGVLAPPEGYAEAFAEWSLTNGKTTNPAALEYAKHFHWGEKFGTD